MDRREGSIRVVMLPWLAHGHFSPFLELAKSLSKRNFITYICSSPVNLDPIKNTLSPKHSNSIKLVELHIPATPTLPPHYHTTNGLPPHLMGPLKRSLDSSQPAFSSILATLRPDLVLYDFLMPWAPEVASLQGIPAAVFFSTGAAASSLLLHFFLREEAEYPFPGMFFRAPEAEYPLSDHARVRVCVQRSSGVVFMKTFKALEGKYIDFLSVLTRKTMVPVGALVYDQNINTDDNHIMEWLDRKDVLSTIFASFGTEYFLSEREIEEIAHGLEMSGVNFIWVLKFPTTVDDNKSSIREKLPEGFMERSVGAGERGMVVERWAPQRRILSHPSVGGFLSHCGWSSVMEGIFAGVPIVALPMQLDQPMNARLVEEVGVGEKAVRSGDGMVDREEVARVVRRVVGSLELRRRVAEMRERMMDEEEEIIDGVVEEMVNMCNKRAGETQILSIHN